MVCDSAMIFVFAVRHVGSQAYQAQLQQDDRSPGGWLFRFEYAPRRHPSETSPNLSSALLTASWSAGR